MFTNSSFFGVPFTKKKEGGTLSSKKTTKKRLKERKKMTSVELKVIGAVGGLTVFMGVQMSIMRATGTKGEGTYGSYFERIHEAQILNAEWFPIGAVLLLALHQKNLNAGQKACVEKCALAFAIGRFLFVSRYYINKQALYFPMAALSNVVLTYPSLVGMVYTLLTA